MAAPCLWHSSSRKATIDRGGLCATVPKTLGAEVYWSDGLTELLQGEPTGYSCPMSLA